MEYHWYEDYWTMPRNLPKGHQFFIGYYQTQRAIRFHVENIHTDQSVFLSTWLLDNGYRVFLHFKSGIVTELKLGDNPPPGGRINSPKILKDFCSAGVLENCQSEELNMDTNRYLKPSTSSGMWTWRRILIRCPKRSRLPDWDDRYGGNLRLFVQSDRLLPQRFWT